MAEPCLCDPDPRSIKLDVSNLEVLTGWYRWDLLRREVEAVKKDMLVTKAQMALLFDETHGDGAALIEQAAGRAPAYFDWIDSWVKRLDEAL